VNLASDNTTGAAPEILAALVPASVSIRPTCVNAQLATMSLVFILFLFLHGKPLQRRASNGKA
jgi:hypothetical protein